MVLRERFDEKYVRDGSLLIKWRFRIWGPRVRIEEGPAPIAQDFGLNGSARGHPRWKEYHYLPCLLLFL